MGPSEAIGGVEKAQKLVTDGPTAFTAAIFAMAFLAMLVLYVKEARAYRDASLKLALAAELLGQVLSEVELLPAKRQRRRTNPGRRLEEG